VAHGGVFLKRLNINPTPDELRQEQGKAGGQDKHNGQEPRQKPRQPQPAGKGPLQRNLPHHTHSMKKKEARHSEAGLRPPQVEQYQLMHQTRYHKCPHHRR